jgi:threonine synthase
VAQLACPNCRRSYPLELPSSTCPICGGWLRVSYDYHAIREGLSREVVKARGFNAWRYLEVLPAKPEWRVVSLGEGGTFIHQGRKLGEEVGIKRLYLKDETTNPTGSFLDRGSSVLTTRLLGLSMKRVACASAGNLGASLAAYAAKAGLQCSVYTTRQVDLGKLYQMAAYGAHVKTLASLSEAEEEAKRSGGFYASSIDPFFLEGLKTTMWEVCEQLQWSSPDVLVMPVGTGGHLYMAWRALKEMEALGFIEEASTRLVAVQTKGCSPIVEAFERGLDRPAPLEKVSVYIQDIGFPNPPLGGEVLRAVRETGGVAVAVSYDEALQAMRQLAELEGVFCEPAAGSTVAGLKKLLEEGWIDRDESVVCVITGEGLKDPKAALKMRELDLKATELLIEGRAGGRLGRTKVEVLRALADGQAHGYGIWARLKELGVGITLPSLYQHLRELLALGLVREAGVEVKKGRRRKLYALTERGLKVSGHAS